VKYYPSITSGWRDIKLYVATGVRQSKGEECFVPLSKDGPLTIYVMACRLLMPPAEDGDYDFLGVIGKNKFIDISLIKNGTTIVGRYRYLGNPNTFIKVDGTLAKDGSFSMIEFGEAGGGISGQFHGSIKEGRISGRWESADKSRNLPFSLYIQGFPQ
jgi:hypothetical protein